MHDDLLSAGVLRAYLKDNLLDLSVKRYHDDFPTQGTLDVLCELTCLQTLHIKPLHMDETWSISSRLSQLTSLRSFHFQRGTLTGSLVAAFASLPALTELKTTYVDGGGFFFDMNHFTALPRHVAH